MGASSKSFTQRPQSAPIATQASPNVTEKMKPDRMPVSANGSVTRTTKDTAVTGRDATWSRSERVSYAMSAPAFTASKMNDIVNNTKTWQEDETHDCSNVWRCYGGLTACLTACPSYHQHSCCGSAFERLGWRSLGVQKRKQEKEKTKSRRRPCAPPFIVQGVPPCHYENFSHVMVSTCTRGHVRTYVRTVRYVRDQTVARVDTSRPRPKYSEYERDTDYAHDVPACVGERFRASFVAHSTVCLTCELQLLRCYYFFYNRRTLNQ